MNTRSVVSASTPTGVLALVALALGLGACRQSSTTETGSDGSGAGAQTSNAAAKPETAKEVPITTSSEEARALYLQGRDLVEKLRVTDGNRYFHQAVEKDPGFAVAWLAAANSSATASDFFDEMKKAVAASSNASEGERLQILGADAGVKSQPASQREQYARLVELYPRDARAHTLLGAHYFGTQDYTRAIEHYNHAISIEPGFSTPYNQLGYAHRFLKQYPEAEQAFKTYIDLIPGEPNPYDSYAELLMKMGRFEESIQQYEKALSIDPNFVPSYVGIANDQIFMGRPEEARKVLTKLHGRARNDGEKRQALTWTVASYLHEGNTRKALETAGLLREVAEKGGDLASVSGDLQLLGNVQLETGSPDAALASYKKAMETIESADVPVEVKDAARRNHLYNAARVALAKGNLSEAKASADEYRKAVEEKQIPFEVRQQHEIAGRIAIAEGDHARAVEELAAANQQDPRVLYLSAIASKKAGDGPKAKEMAAEAASFNAENVNYAFVRGKAQDMLKAL